MLKSGVLQVVHFSCKLCLIFAESLGGTAGNKLTGFLSLEYLSNRHFFFF